jgi:hypothetical protein
MLLFQTETFNIADCRGMGVIIAKNDPYQNKIIRVMPQNNSVNMPISFKMIVFIVIFYCFISVLVEGTFLTRRNTTRTNLR